MNRRPVFTGATVMLTHIHRLLRAEVCSYIKRYKQLEQAYIINTDDISVIVLVLRNDDCDDDDGNDYREACDV